MAKLQTITRFLDRHLRIPEIADYPGAMNGLQIENGGDVTRIAAAVDGCAATIEMAVAEGADLLIVHHGLFWSGVQPLVGSNYRKFKVAMDANLAVYSAHLPLDMHPTLGNNALLCKALGLPKTEPFLHEKGQFIGLKATLKIQRNALLERVKSAVDGSALLCPGGPESIRHIGVVTGGAGAEVAKAAAEGVDTFITGEGPHWSYPTAEEIGLNVIYAGHYATETFGVKALAALLSKRYRIPWTFLDHPTGL
jgi:dinuclear metal center YbgI/SA1388 family protein